MDGIYYSKELVDTIAKSIGAPYVGTRKWNESITNETEYQQGKDGKTYLGSQISSFWYCKCLDISDVSYKNDIYTIKYIYCRWQNGMDVSEEELPRYQTTIQLKLNENAKYSKYKIVSLTEGILVEKK